MVLLIGSFDAKVISCSPDKLQTQLYFYRNQFMDLLIGSFDAKVINCSPIKLQTQLYFYRNSINFRFFKKILPLYFYNNVKNKSRA